MVVSIEVDHVSKLFHKRYQRTLKQTVVARLQGRKVSDTFWALDDVTFNVEQGEASWVSTARARARSSSTSWA
jgi:ABC-2 type transport system ATP-binding protein